MCLHCLHVFSNHFAQGQIVTLDLFSKSKTIKPVGFCLTAYLHLSPLTWPPLGQVGHGVEGACCRGWWMSSLLSPMWFCSAFFSMLLCTLNTKCALLCFIKIISHLHLLQHYRTHSLHPCRHTFWECQRVNISVYLHGSCFGKVAGLTCC